MNWIDKLERKFGRHGWNTESDSVYYYLLCDRVFAHLYESIAAQYDRVWMFPRFCRDRSGVWSPG